MREHKFIMPLLFLIYLVTLQNFTYLYSQKKNNFYLSSWTKSESPKIIGKRISERFIESPHPNFGKNTPPKSITYPESCTWYGALEYSRLTGNKSIEENLIKRFEPLFTPEGSKMIPDPTHVDRSVFGIVPLELYIITKDAHYLKIGKSIADKQWENPIRGGLSPQSRFWIDDMYMITSLQVQAYRATKDTIYLNRAALEMATYLDTLQQPSGLFYHAEGAPFYWGRGDGWVAAGMSILLKYLPESNPLYKKIMAGYRKMMAALLKYQDTNGMWHQLIDQPNAWPETSCTAMFTFAIITGVKEGWLNNKVYGPVARKGWLGLLKYLDSNSDLHNVCEGTNKNSDMQYYLDRKRNIGDMHGQAALLWCADALLR
jgi:unsaturated rhamnogalacturonyl hydrolase